MRETAFDRAVNLGMRIQAAVSKAPHAIPVEAFFDRGSGYPERVGVPLASASARTPEKGGRTEKWFHASEYANLPEEMMTKDTADKPPAAEQANPFENLVPGRIVHYWPAPYEEKNCAPGPWPAMVTKVGENGRITINVQMPAPAPIGTDPVLRMENVPYSPEKAPRSWSWIFEGQAGRYKPDRTA